MLRKKISAVGLALVLSLGLTACDPPMPEAMLVAIAEQSYNCEDGNVNFYADAGFVDLAYSWIDGVGMNCPNMTLTQVTEATEADIIISGSSSMTCPTFASTPYAIDAAAVVYNSTEFGALNLTPKLISEIFAKKITNWNDPAIQEVNPDSVFPDLSINVISEAEPAQIKSFEEWLSRVEGSEIKISGTTAPSQPLVADRLYEFPDGSIAIASASDATITAANIANIVVGTDLVADAIAPDAGTISSAATQLVASKTSTAVSVALDSALKPTPPEGSDDIIAPYQALVPVTMSLCGTDTLLIRAAARFLIRADIQGNLASATYLPLPEKIRVLAVPVIAAGLPTPTPAELPAE